MRSMVLYWHARDFSQFIQLANLVNLLDAPCLERLALRIAFGPLVTSTAGSAVCAIESFHLGAHSRQFNRPDRGPRPRREFELLAPQLERAIDPYPSDHDRIVCHAFGSNHIPAGV